MPPEPVLDALLLVTVCLVIATIRRLISLAVLLLLLLVLAAAALGSGTLPIQ